MKDEEEPIIMTNLNIELQNDLFLTNCVVTSQINRHAPGRQPIPDPDTSLAYDKATRVKVAITIDYGSHSNEYTMSADASFVKKTAG